ncbi:haloacid dehalogenase-like hydrolase domain-containing protein At4g39970 [Aegilops tauschii subsp. strangulata]|uniref:haloacid dehalogenase-like hydrolase domain-containing protein At4g39970 n=1 Tax=Aegilops tauschii subsp. strangulata TaxID=200361 RepID=UPI000989DD8E|nr:haloacid dehalogenase-like hydrolase domain-containing protein At4g39970 [Aegilops tauschii subsp. strangulata]
MPPMGMASTSLLAPTSFAPAAVAATARRSFFSHRPTSSLPAVRLRLTRTSSLVASASASPPRSLDALIFDCDGVILESEHLHRQAYNDAFAHFGVRCPPAADADTPLYWDEAFYDDLQNRIGGGKPKMRWYFGENGWPTSKILETAPSSDEDREKLVDVIQDWKTERYKAIIKSGTVEPRPGVLRLMDEVKGAGIKLAVCSAATKSSVVLCLENLLGLERFNGLDCFLAGDDVKMKKPDPSIYITAAKKLGLESKNCLVVEDSVIGLQAAKGAGMSCIITYTPSTANQDFKDAIATYPDLSNVRLEDLKLLLQESLVTG